jgi:large subunit ribosomal protein L7/L12
MTVIPPPLIIGWPTIETPAVDMAVEPSTPPAPAALGVGRFGVKLVAVGVDKKLDVIKAVRELTQCGLADAKNIVEAAPTIVCAGLSQEGAIRLQHGLMTAGAIAQIEQG